MWIFFRFLLEISATTEDFTYPRKSRIAVFYRRSSTLHPWVKISMSKILPCLLLSAFRHWKICSLPFKGAGIKICLSETKNSKSSLTYKPVLNCGWTFPRQSSCSNHLVGNSSRLWFLFLDSPEVFIIQDVEFKSKEDVSSAVLSTWSLFFSAMNANLLQTCLELLSAWPASSSSVKDSS